MAGTITLNYKDETGAGISKKIFEALLPAIEGERELDLVLVTDPSIRELNKKHRGKDAPTDVISFAYDETSEFPGPNPLGEIYISLPAAERQAGKLGHTLEYELQFLFVHGALHILGYTHETPQKHDEMMAKAEEILRTTSSSSRKGEV